MHLNTLSQMAERGHSVARFIILVWILEGGVGKVGIWPCGQVSAKTKTAHTFIATTSTSFGQGPVLDYESDIFTVLFLLPLRPLLVNLKHQRHTREADNMVTSRTISFLEAE